MPVKAAQERNVEPRALRAEVMRQIADGHSPRLADSGGASRQLDVIEVCGPAKVLIARNHHFAAPNATIGAISGTVQGKADDAAFEMMLRHATGDVRMVVLNSNQLHSLLLKSPAGAKVVGMQIVSHDRWLYLGESCADKRSLARRSGTIQSFPDRRYAG